MFSGTAQVSHQVFRFFFLVSSVCLLVRVTIVDKNKAVGFPEWTAQLSVWRTTGNCAVICV